MNDLKQGDIFGERYESCHGMSIVVNHKELLCKQTGYQIHQTLLSFNNALHKLIVKEHTRQECYVDHGSGGQSKVRLALVHNDVFLSTIGGEKLQYELVNEKCALSALVEEVIRAVNEYKEVCHETITSSFPDYVLPKMYELFGREEKYTDTGLAAYDWEKYFSSLKEFKHAYNKIIVHVASSIEEANSLLQVAGGLEKQRVGEKHIIIHNYYNWLPLECAWNRRIVPVVS